MTTTLLAAAEAPKIDWAGLSPLIALLGGAVIVLMLGLFRARFAREQLVPFLSLVAVGAAIGLTIWQWDERLDLISGAMRLDPLSLTLNLVLLTAAAATILLSWRANAPRESAHGEYHSLLQTSAPIPPKFSFIFPYP